MVLISTKVLFLTFLSEALSLKHVNIMEQFDLQPSSEKELVREISHNLSSASGWMKFLGVIMIFYGILIAITIVGIIFAWLPIWMGILLFRAASQANYAINLGDKKSLKASLQYINNFFTINGILFIVMMLLTILSLIILWGTGISLERLESILL